MCACGELNVSEIYLIDGHEQFVIVHGDGVGEFFRAEHLQLLPRATLWTFLFG